MHFTDDDCNQFAVEFGKQIRSVCRSAAQLLRKTPPNWFTEIIQPTLPGQTQREEALLFGAAPATPIESIDDACQ